ncbi:MAG: alpha/beta hydrolase [Bdellovibrionales bacterium]
MIQRPPETFSEEPFAIPTPDGKKIYGILNKSKSPNGKTILISHGLTGHSGEYLHVTARNLFTQCGYDVVRFNYYDAPPDARKLEECTIQTHADDLNLVGAHVRKTSTNLYVVGHSYGGLTLIHANPEVKALAFWDSSFFPYKVFWKDEAPQLGGTTFYHICGWGCHNLINPAMIDFDRNMEESGIIALAKKIQTPSLVALAEKSQENPVRTIIYDTLTCPKKLVDIAGANHIFSNGHTAYDLLQETIDWFDAH